MPRARPSGASLLVALLVAVLAVVLLYPIGLTLRGAFASDPARGTGFTVQHLLLLFEQPVLVEAMVRTVGVAAVTTVLSLALGVPLAILSVRYTFPGKSVFGVLILAPLILPPFVGAIGMKMLLGREGALNALLGTDWNLMAEARFWGVVVVEALHLYPIIYLNTAAALSNLDPALDEAAVNLGAGWWHRFTRITAPLIRPGVFGGATLVFIWSLTELGTPLLFDYPQVLPVQIFIGLKQVENSAQPYALTVVLLAGAVVAYLVGRLVLAGRAYPTYSKAARAAAERRLGAGARLGVLALFVVVTGVSLLPHASVILTSLAEPGSWYRAVVPRGWTGEHYVSALTHPDAFGSIAMSLRLALVAVVADLVLGLAAAYLIVRTSASGRWLLDALCMLPLAVPGLVMAFGYVAMSLRWPFGDGPLGGLVSVVGADPRPFALLATAYAVRRLPYVVRAAVSGLEQTPVELEEAAWNLGASRFAAVRRVVVPLIAANLVAGALLAFSFSMLEVSDSLMLAQQQRDFPITKAIYSFVGRLGDGAYIASAMGVWGMALLAVALVGAGALLGRRMGQIFRA